MAAEPERSASETPRHPESPYPGMPRWAKVNTVFVALLILAVAAMSTGLGGHGGGSHGPAHGTNVEDGNR